MSIWRTALPHTTDTRHWVTTAGCHARVNASSARPARLHFTIHKCFARIKRCLLLSSAAEELLKDALTNSTLAVSRTHQADGGRSAPGAPCLEATILTQLLALLMRGRPAWTGTQRWPSLCPSAKREMNVRIREAEATQDNGDPEVYQMRPQRSAGRQHHQAQDPKWRLQAKQATVRRSNDIRAWAPDRRCHQHHRRC
jgi:hypothetical protein